MYGVRSTYNILRRTMTDSLLDPVGQIVNDLIQSILLDKVIQYGCLSRCGS